MNMTHVLAVLALGAIWVAAPLRAEEGAKVAGDADKALVEKQLPAYPTNQCVVADESIEKEAVNLIYKDKLYRLCCKDCIKEFNKSPDKFAAKLEEITKKKAAAPGPK